MCVCKCVNVCVVYGLTMYAIAYEDYRVKKHHTHRFLDYFCCNLLLYNYQ